MTRDELDVMVRRGLADGKSLEDIAREFRKEYEDQTGVFMGWTDCLFAVYSARDRLLPKDGDAPQKA